MEVPRSAAVDPGSSSLVAGEPGVSGTAKSLFVLTLDVPFTVVFTAPAALTSSRTAHGQPAQCSDELLGDGDGGGDSRATSPSMSSSGVSGCDSPVHAEVTVERHQIMPRDVTSHDVTSLDVTSPSTDSNGRARNSRNERRPQRASSHHDRLARPRSRSACNGKYCSVNGLRPLYCADRKYCWSTAGTPSLRPLSATTAPRRHHRRLPNDVIAYDDDDTASGNTTSSSGLADSGVTSSASSGAAHNDAIASRETSPAVSDDDDKEWTMWCRQWMTVADRQSQLRRFLDALKDHHHHHPHDVTDTVDGQLQRHRHRKTAGRHCHDPHTSVATASHVWQGSAVGSSEHETTSAMDRVRNLVNRRQLPVYVSKAPPSTDAEHRLDRWKRTIEHQSTTSETIDQHILTAATELISLSAADELVASQLLNLSGRIQTYKLQLYTQRHRDVIDSVALDPDDEHQPPYVDLDLDRSDLVAASHLVRCGITRSHLHSRRRFSIF